MRNQLMGDLGALLTGYTQAKMQGDMAGRQKHLQAIRELGLQARSVAETGVAMERLKQEQQATALQRERWGVEKPYIEAQTEQITERVTGMKSVREREEEIYQQIADAVGQPIEVIRAQDEAGTLGESIAKSRERQRLGAARPEAIAEVRGARAEIEEAKTREEKAVTERELLPEEAGARRAEAGRVKEEALLAKEKATAIKASLPEILEREEISSIGDILIMGERLTGMKLENASTSVKIEAYNKLREILAEKGKSPESIEAEVLMSKLLIAQTPSAPDQEFYWQQMSTIERVLSNIEIRGTATVDEMVAGIPEENRGWVLTMMAMTGRTGGVSEEDKEAAKKTLQAFYDVLLKNARSQHPTVQWPQLKMQGGKISEADYKAGVEVLR